MLSLSGPPSRRDLPALARLLSRTSYCARLRLRLTPGPHSEATPHFWLCWGGYLAFTWCGSKLILQVVARYDANTTALVVNVRRACTLAISFVLFPKPLTHCHAAGALLVLGGVWRLRDMRVHRLHHQRAGAREGGGGWRKPKEA